MKEKGIEWDRLMLWYVNQKEQIELTYKLKTTSKKNPKHMSSKSNKQS